MSATTFYDLLGIDPYASAQDRASAARTVLEPFLGENGLVSLTQGYNVGDTVDSMIDLLQYGLVFTNVHPGVSPAGHTATAANMAVVEPQAGPQITQRPFYLRALPDHGIQLTPTDPLHPAHVFFVTDGVHRELIIDGLPVKIFLKPGLASQLAGPPQPVGSFDASKPDGFAYTLGDDVHPTEIDCLIRLRLTPENDLILEASVPISLGPVRWMGLPATAVYDIALIPSPNRREYFEWARNDLSPLDSNPLASGALGFRSIDVDFTDPSFNDMRKRLQDGAINISNLELVLEDVVLPVDVPILPIPSHGTFGFRRKITDRTDIAQAYSLANAPAQIVLYNSDKSGGDGGTKLILQVEEFLVQSGDAHALNPADQPQVQFLAELIWNSQSGVRKGFTLGLDAEWTLSAGVVIDNADTPLKFTIADTTVGLVGVKVGIAFGRLAKQMPFGQSYDALGDFYITAKPTGSDSSSFKIRSLTGKPLSIVAKDIGWHYGHFSLDGLQFPDGMQLIFGDTIVVTIEEAGWVEEPNGTPYFSFSGGVAWTSGSGQQTKPSGNAADDDANGIGIKVRRLRFNLDPDNGQPPFKIDGIFLKLKFPAIDVEGFGFISDYTDSGFEIKEWGFGIKIGLGALGMNWSFAGEFVKGLQRSIADSTQKFDFTLAAARLSYLPAGPIGLYNIRALFADNMAPNLDSAFPDGEGIALLKWHQDHDQALNLPANRSLADWRPEHDAFALGVGCGFSINGCGSVAHLEVFIFFAKSNADTGLLIVGDVMLWQNPKPIAFVAIEYDLSSEKFGLMAGVNLTAADLTSGAAPDWLARIATLSGNLYFGNQPWQFAIGQLADQTTWLGIRVNWDVWITVKFDVFLALQIVDGGPKGVGFAITLSAGSNWGIGAFTLWGSFGFILGTWQTGSTSMGAEIWLSVGFKINLFSVFSFGAEIGGKFTYLGKHPWFLTVHFEIRIDTPWFLPDVTFTLDRTWQKALPFDTATLTSSLASAAAGIDPRATQQEQPLLAPGLSGALGDSTFLYTFNQLNGLDGIRISDPHARDDIPLVSVDATIAVNLAQPVANDSMIAGATITGAGVQQVQDFTARYGLTSVSVRRAPRFGPTAGTWTDFLTDAQTGFSVGGVAPQSLTFAWDADTRADGNLAAKRLLVNSSSPYSFATQGSQNDEEAAANDPNFPCCGLDRKGPLPIAHVVMFTGLSTGSRAPRVQQFSNGGASWQWVTPLPPVIASGEPTFAGATVAWLYPQVSSLLGVVNLPAPAVVADVELGWDAFPGFVFLEGYDGMQLISSAYADLHTAGSTMLSLKAPPTTAGLFRATLRVAVDPGTVPTSGGQTFTPGLGIAVEQIGYYTMADYRQSSAAAARCENPVRLGPPGSDASGKLAWLPNHDYEIVITTSIALGTKTQSTRTHSTREALYFRTKGLPGLNACPNTGDDIRQHVDTTYPPRRATPLYRSEPCVLAFENSLSSILPIDRAPGPNDPPEKAQMLPLALNVDRISSLNGMKRLTVPSSDWILAHRADPYPSLYVVAEPRFAVGKVRYTKSSDPLVLRYEALRSVGASQCQPQPDDHASQVLLHEPIDENGNPGLWEADTGYRATVRQHNGPFTERSGFDIYDLGAFIMQADGSATAALWSVDGSGNLMGPATGGGRNYASCGELGWDHLQVHTRVDLAGASAAGIAVGVSDGTPVPSAVLATVEPDGGGFSLVVRIRNGGKETEAGRAPVTISGSFPLEVLAYDDIVRARIGTTTVDAPRGTVRQGRVALVADGPATFAGIAVDALDIYTFEFATSKFASFATHLSSWDGTLPALNAGALGAVPTPIATVLTAHATDLPGLMAAATDPQERQRAFDAIVSALGIGLRKNNITVTVTRLTDANGTFGLALESPEPISLTRDVTLTLIQHTRVWIPGPTPPPRPGPVQFTTLALPSPLTTNPVQTGSEPTASADLSQLTFGTQRITETAPTGLAPGDLVASVMTGPNGTRIDIYDPPAAGGALRETLTPAQAARQPAYTAIANLPPGVITVIKPGGATGPVIGGHWIEKDTVIAITTLSNGDETKMLLLSSTPLGPGDFTLQLVLDRDRWPISTGSDPEQHYHDKATLSLQW